MSINLNTDITSLIAQRSLKGFNSSSLNTMERLSTGIRINYAKDDAANLMLSKNLESTNRGLRIVNQNIQTGLAKLDTYDASLQSMTDGLQKIRTLALQSANGVYSDSERAMLNSQAQQLLSGINQTSAIANNDLSNIDGKISEEEALAAGYDSAHIISDANELVSKISADLGGDFILLNDINMGSLGTLTDAAITGVFTGTFDGQGYSISNLKIDTGGAATSRGIGVFKEANGAEIKNVVVESANISASASRSVSPLVGVGHGATISNCYTSGTISGDTESGGIVGAIDLGSSISNVASGTNVTSGSAGGGLIGALSATTVTNTYATGDIDVAGNYGGGLIGVGVGTTTVTNSYATGDVQSGAFSGGLVGLCQDTDVQDSYALGNVTGGTRVGGITGELRSGSVLQNTFWNTDIITKGVGLLGPGTDNTVGLTSIEISEGATSVTGSWNSSTWDTSNGAPTLNNVGPKELKSMSLQIGADESTGSQFVMSDFTASISNTFVNLNSAASARGTIVDIDRALKHITEKSAKLGANIHKLSSIMDLNGGRETILAQATSSIRDTDMAIEAANLSKNQILSQSATSVLQQAQKINTNSILSLY